MPNLGYLVDCPYYKSEKPMSITCEDTLRVFTSKEKKQRHIESFCVGANNWQNCKYAQSLADLYKNHASEEEMQRHYGQETRKELLKLTSEVGKRRKQCERLTEEIKSLKIENKALQENVSRWRQRSVEAAQKERSMADEINTLANLYERWFAYLMSTGMISALDVDMAEEWAKAHEYRLIPSFEGDKDSQRVKSWKCEVRLSESSEEK